MLNISKPLSSGQAQTYHKLEFTAETANYYKQDGAVQGQWQGQLAEKMGAPVLTTVLGKGANKASIQYGLDGLQVDLRALPHESYGAAMQLAVEQADLVKGKTYPNPPVGAVILSSLVIASAFAVPCTRTMPASAPRTSPACRKST